MTYTCQHYQDQIITLVNRDLSQRDSVSLKEHMASCANCQAYYNALDGHDHLYGEFADMMNKRLSQIEKQVIETLDADLSREPKRPAPRRLARNTLLKWAALAAVLLVAVGGFWFVEHHGSTSEETVQENRTATETLLAEQQRVIKTLIANHDIDGLISMLNQGLWDSKCLAALGLKDIGDQRALADLAKLSTLWQGDPMDNPFDQAITAIQQRIEPTESVPSVISTPNEPKPAAIEVEPAVTPSSNQVHGQIVNRQGEPVAQAQMVLYHNVSGTGFGNEVVEKTMSDAQGHYRFLYPVESTQDSPFRSEWIIQALHPDYAFGWKSLPNKQLLEAYEVILSDPVTKTILVTDVEGQPLAGAVVWPYSAGTKESPDPLFRDTLSMPTNTGLVSVLTNQEGLATFTNLPDTGCSFHADLDGFAQGLSFPSQDTIHLTLGATVLGQVITPDGQGVSHATITLEADWGYWSFWKTETDENGLFTFKDVPANGWDMSPWGQGKTGNGTYVVTLDHAEASLPETKLTLERGQILEDYVLVAQDEMVLVECLVVSPDTNEPIPGARIGGTSLSGRIDGHTDANGILSCRVLSGDMSLFFNSPPKGIYMLEEQGSRGPTQRFVASGSRMQITLTAPAVGGALVTVEGFVLGPDGSPRASDAKVYAAASERFNTATAGSYIRPVSIDSAGLFQLKEVPAGLTVSLYVETKDRTLAAVGIHDIPKDPNETPFLEIKLRPTETAHTVILYDDGSPMADRKIELSPVVGGCWLWPAQRGRRIGPQGELDMTGIVPGLTYRMRDTEAFNNRRSSTEDSSRPAELDRVLIPLGVDE